MRMLKARTNEGERYGMNSFWQLVRGFCLENREATKDCNDVIIERSEKSWERDGAGFGHIGKVSDVGC